MRTTFIVIAAAAALSCSKDKGAAPAPAAPKTPEPAAVPAPEPPKAEEPAKVPEAEAAKAPEAEAAKASEAEAAKAPEAEAAKAPEAEPAKAPEAEPAKAPEAEAAKAPEAAAEPSPEAAKAPEAPANPVIAELAPLWPDIAKCEDISDYYAAEKCPANFKLLEAAKAAYEGKDTDAARFDNLHAALVDQIINGTDLKARSCAAYADWSKAYRGGDKAAEDAAQATALLEALKKLEQEDASVGYGIANILSGWWQKDSEVRKQMTAVIADKAVKSAGGRAELVRHASWTFKDNAELLGVIKAIAIDTGDATAVRIAAIDGLGTEAANNADLVDVFITLTSDADTQVQGGATRALGRVAPATDAAKKAQTRLLEIAQNRDHAAASAAPSALGQVGDLEGLAAFGTWHKANAATQGVTAAMRDAVWAYAFSNRFAGDAAADAAMRKAVDAVLKDKGATPWDIRYMMDTLGKLGGKKSEASCKKYEKHADASVVESAKKCVEAAKAAPK